VPEPTERSHPIEKGRGVAIQINDVDLDDRGLCDGSDGGRTVCTSAQRNYEKNGHVKPVVMKGEPL
jgi:hypothetical protein